MMFLQIVANVVRKDWRQNIKTLILFAGSMIIALYEPDNEIKLGLMGGILVGAAFGYTYFVFSIEHARRSLPLLLGLPVRPADLVISKYVSLYSLCLLTVNLGGFFLHDFRMLYLLNAEILFLATVFMATVVIWDHPMAAVIPLFILALVAQRNTVFKELAPYAFPIASFALSITPVIAIVSVFQFSRNSRPL